MLKIALAFLILVAFNLIAAYLENGGSLPTAFLLGIAVLAAGIFVLLRPAKAAPKAPEKAPSLPKRYRGGNITAW